MASTKFKNGDTVFCEAFKKYGVFQCYNPQDLRFCVVTFANWSPSVKEIDMLTMGKSLRLVNEGTEK